MGSKKFENIKLEAFLKISTLIGMKMGIPWLVKVRPAYQRLGKFRKVGTLINHLDEAAFTLMTLNSPLNISKLRPVPLRPR